MGGLAVRYKEGAGGPPIGTPGRIRASQDWMKALALGGSTWAATRAWRWSVSGSSRTGVASPASGSSAPLATR
jgi:hypothetical protein